MASSLSIAQRMAKTAEIARDSASKLIPGAVKYGGNVTASLARVYISTFKSNLPSVFSFAETNAELGRDIMEAIKDPLGAIKAKTGGEGSFDWRGELDRIKKNTLEDLRTGKFFDENRRNDVGLFGDDDAFGGIDFDDAWGDDFDDDFDIDGDGGPSEDTRLTLKSDKSIAIAQEKSADERARATIGAMGSVASAIVSSQASIHKNEVGMMAAMHGNMMSGMSNISSAVTASVHAMTAHFTNLNSMIEASTNKIVGKLESIETILKNAFPERKASSGSSSGKAQPFGSGGDFNIKEYFKQVWENIDTETGAMSTVGLASGLGGGPKGLIRMATQNPLAFLLTPIVSSTITKTFKETMKVFDESFKVFAKNMISRITSWRDKDGIMGWVGRIFGITTDDKTGYSTAKYNRGEWEPKTLSESLLTRISKATSEVIPAYLRDIANALTGRDRIFNYDSGKFVDPKKSLEGYDRRRDITEYTYDTKNYIDRITRNKWGYKDKYSYVSDKIDIMDAIRTIASEQLHFNPRLKKSPSYSISQSTWDKLREIFQDTDPRILQNITAEVFDARAKRKESLESAEKDLISSGLISMYNQYGKVNSSSGVFVGKDFATDIKNLHGISATNRILIDIRQILLGKFFTDGGGGGNLPKFPLSPDQTKSYNDDERERLEREYDYLDKGSFFEDVEEVLEGKDPKPAPKGFKRIIEALNKIVKSPFELMNSGMKWMDKMMFKMVYGTDEDPETSGKSLFEKISLSITKQWEKFTNWMDEKLFGPEGLFTKGKKAFKEQIFDKYIQPFVIDKFKKAKDWAFGENGKFTPYINQMKAGIGMEGGIFEWIKKSWKKGKAAGNQFWGIDATAKEGMNFLERGFFELFKSIKSSAIDLKKYLFGDDAVDDKGNSTGIKNKSTKLWESIKKATKGYMPEGFKNAFKGMAVWKGVGMLSGFFLPGGPIFAGLLGAFGGLIKRSEGLQEYLFGQMERDAAGNPVKDENGNPVFKGGIFSNKARDVFFNFLPKAGIGAAAGGLVGSFFGAPFLGKIFGAWTGIAAGSAKFQQLLFGKGAQKQIGVDENGKPVMGPDPDAGLLSKNRIKGIAKFLGFKSLGAMAYSSLSKIGIFGFSLLPGGPIWSSLAGIGLALNRDAVSAYFFGKKDKNGNIIPGKEGALYAIVEKVKEKVLQPVANVMNKLGAGIHGWLNNKMLPFITKRLEPMKRALDDMKDRFKFAFLDMFRGIAGVGNKIAGFIWSRLTGKGGALSKLLGNFTAKRFIGGAQFALGLPFHLLSGFGRINDGYNKLTGNAIGTRRDSEKARRLWMRGQLEGVNMDDYELKSYGTGLFKWRKRYMITHKDGESMIDVNKFDEQGKYIKDVSENIIPTKKPDGTEYSPAEQTVLHLAEMNKKAEIEQEERKEFSMTVVDKLDQLITNTSCEMEGQEVSVGNQNIFAKRYQINPAQMQDMGPMEQQQLLSLANIGGGQVSSAAERAKLLNMMNSNVKAIQNQSDDLNDMSKSLGARGMHDPNKADAVKAAMDVSNTYHLSRISKALAGDAKEGKPSLFDWLGGLLGGLGKGLFGPMSLLGGLLRAPFALGKMAWMGGKALLGGARWAFKNPLARAALAIYGMSRNFDRGFGDVATHIGIREFGLKRAIPKIKDLMVKYPQSTMQGFFGKNYAQAKLLGDAGMMDIAERNIRATGDKFMGETFEKISKNSADDAASRAAKAVINAGDDVVEAGTSVAAKTAKGSVKTGSKGWVARVLKWIKDALKKGIGLIVGKFDWGRKLLSKVDDIAIRISKNIAKNAARFAATKVGKAATRMIPYVGWALIAADLASGYAEAPAILEVNKDDVTFGMRLTAAVAKAASSFLMVFTPQDIATFIYPVFMNERDKLEYDEKRKGFRAEYQEYVKAGGTYDFDAWNTTLKNPTIWNSFWNGAKSIFGFNRKHNEQEAIHRRLTEEYAKVAFNQEEFNAKHGASGYTFGSYTAGAVGNVMGAAGAIYDVVSKGLGFIGEVLSGIYKLLSGGYGGFGNGHGVSEKLKARLRPNSYGRFGFGYAPGMPDDAPILQQPKGNYGEMISQASAAREEYREKVRTNINGIIAHRDALTAKVERIRLNDSNQWQVVPAIPYESEWGKSGISENEYKFMCGFIMAAQLIRIYAGVQATPIQVYNEVRKLEKKKGVSYISEEGLGLKYEFFGDTEYWKKYNIGFIFNIQKAMLASTLNNKPTIEKIQKALSKKQPIVLLGKSMLSNSIKGSPFTSMFHYCMITAIDYPKAKFYITDPLMLKSGWYTYEEVLGSHNIISNMMFTYKMSEGLEGSLGRAGYDFGANMGDEILVPEEPTETLAQEKERKHLGLLEGVSKLFSLVDRGLDSYGVKEDSDTGHGYNFNRGDRSDRIKSIISNAKKNTVKLNPTNINAGNVYEYDPRKMKNAQSYANLENIEERFKYVKGAAVAMNVTNPLFLEMVRLQTETVEILKLMVKEEGNSRKEMKDIVRRLRPTPSGYGSSSSYYQPKSIMFDYTNSIKR